MIESLEKLQKSRATRLDYPCLFDDSNIQSVYGMLDPTNRGFITYQQYKEGVYSYLYKYRFMLYIVYNEQSTLNTGCIILFVVYKYT